MRHKLKIAAYIGIVFGWANLAEAYFSESYSDYKYVITKSEWESVAGMFAIASIISAFALFFGQDGEQRILKRKVKTAELKARLKDLESKG
jgi:hypothetical protein